MKNSEMYTKLMNQIEIIHAENLALMRIALLTAKVDEKVVDELTIKWDKRFQDERNEW